MLAADSALHLRTWERSDGTRREFRGLIGVLLDIKQPRAFIDWYDTTINAVFEQFGIERRRHVYKSTQITSEFPEDPSKLLYFLNDFVRELIQVDREVLYSINWYHLTIDIKRLQTERDPTEWKDKLPLDQKLIRVYGEPGAEGGEWLGISDFINLLRNYYPLICAWKLSKRINISQKEVLVDGCTGPVSQAWRELLRSCKKVSILFHGDQYSPFISTCDLCVRWINETLRRSSHRLNRDSLETLARNWKGVSAELDTDHIFIDGIWNPDLAMIVPVSREKIQRYERLFVKYPITFLVHEPNPYFSDKKAFEMSPLFDALTTDLVRAGGSYLWYAGNPHHQLIKSGDRFLIWGEKGEAIVTGLQKLGYEIKVIKPEDILHPGGPEEQDQSSTSNSEK